MAAGYHLNDLSSAAKIDRRILHTIDDHWRGTVPVCALEKPSLLFYSNPRFGFGLIVMAFQGLWSRWAGLDPFLGFRWLNAAISAVGAAVFLLLARNSIPPLLRWGVILAALGQPLSLLLSISGFQEVLCACLLLLLAHSWGRNKMVCAVLAGYLPLVRAETIFITLGVSISLMRSRRILPGIAALAPLSAFQLAGRWLLGDWPDAISYAALGPFQISGRSYWTELKPHLLETLTSYGWITSLGLLAAVGTGLWIPKARTNALLAASYLLGSAAAFTVSPAQFPCGRYVFPAFVLSLLCLPQVVANAVNRFPSLKRSLPPVFAVWAMMSFVEGLSIWRRGLPPQSSAYQFGALAKAENDPFRGSREWLLDYLKRDPVDWVFFSWEFYDVRSFTAENCFIFRRHQLLFGPPRPPDDYVIAQWKGGVPVLDLGAMKVRKSLPENQPGLMITRSRRYAPSSGNWEKIAVFPNDVQVFRHTPVR